MLILGMDTATAQVGVAVGRGHTVLASECLAGGRRHAEELVPAIERVTRAAGVALSELDALAVGVGPGMFTGLRVGVTTARTLAQSLELPLVGVSSLELVAWPVRGRAARVVAVLDARRHEVFAARYCVAAEGELVPAGVEAVLAPGALVDELAGWSDDGEAVLAVGEGAQLYEEVLGGVPGVTIGDTAHAFPSPTGLVELAVARLAAGTDPEPVLPRYLRRSDAEIAWDAR